MPKLQMAADGLPDARSRLNYIASKTADAANKVLNLVDSARPSTSTSPTKPAAWPPPSWPTR